MLKVLTWSWRAWTTLCGLCVLCFGFAYALAHLSAGTGAVVVVDSAPEDPTTRVPLGGNIRYGLRWRYVEGGCDVYVVATFTKQDGREETTLFQRRKARPRGVGQPGYEMIERPLPSGITPGRWRYKTTIEATCPTRKAPDVPFVEFDIEVFDPAAPVVTVQALTVTTPIVRFGTKLGWRISFTRRLDLPGETIATYFAEKPSLVPGLTDIVTVRRPLAYTRVGEYRDVDVVQEAPPELWTGRWRLRLTALARFPDGREQIDSVGEGMFEVVP